jgi:sialidase-1
MKIVDISRHEIFRHEAHCINQIATRMTAAGELVAVFNEERFPFHHDSGRTLMARSADGGVTWSEPTIVLDWTETTGNWDCGFCETAEGAWIVNLTIAGFSSAASGPRASPG